MEFGLRSVIIVLVNLLPDIDVSGKRVFVRADLDVPLDHSRRVGNKEQDNNHESLETSTRLVGIKPTIDYLRGKGARQIIIAGKIGRPKGRRDPSLSTLRIKGALEKILDIEIAFCDDVDSQPLGDVVLLENMHFWPEELEPSEDFAKKLAALADVYVNENFASAHRNETSVSLLPRYLPHAAGLHLQKEVEELSKLLKNPQRPFVAIVGGAKIETKVPVISNLVKVVDWVVVGGELPIEITKNGSKYQQNVVISVLTDNQKDISDSSMIQIIELIKKAKTVVWNGPMGRFEEGFEKGTLAVADAIIESGAYSVVGGGETTEFLASKNLLSRFSFVSSGGGAMLQFLAGKELPGIRALE